MKNSVIFVLSVVVAITALLLSGKYMSHPKKTAQANTQPDATGPEKGSLAPDFNLKVLGGDGKTIKLSSLRGKGVLVNFWATYCEPCKVEMPWLVELQNKYGPEGLQIVGVAVDDVDEKTISDFVHKMGVNYPVLIGTEKVADTYGGINGLPMSFYLDRDGKVVDRILGLVSKSEIEADIQKSLAQGNATTAASK